MSLRLSDADSAILTVVAEHHVLTVVQLAIVLGRNPNSLCRRLNVLAEQGMINVLARRRPALQGRPEHMVTLCEPGFDLLRACGRVPRSAAWIRESARRSQNAEHELLINDLRVQLVQLERLLPAFQVRYLARRLISADEEPESVPTIHETIHLEDSDETVEFVPDGVFSLTHRELGKTLLFFLEADRATEPLTSARGRNRGLAAKIVAYQAYLQTGQYERYEDILRTKLRGFLLLLLVDGVARWASACRLAREMPPSNFIWLTSRDQLLSAGCWSAIWAEGGKITEPLQSILGSKMPQRCPSPGELAHKLPRRTPGTQDDESAHSGP